MTERNESNASLEARVAELERLLAGQSQSRQPRSWRWRFVAVAALALTFLVPGLVVATHQFSDVPDGGFHDDIDWMADYGITQGFGDGTFRPTQAVTRQAAAAFLHRLSNEFAVVTSSTDPAAGMYFNHYAECPSGKRAIAGGGYSSSINTLMTGSYPNSAYTRFQVYWESDNDATVDPGTLIVWALCAPRL